MPSPRRAQPPARKPSRNRDRILAVARRMMARKGYAATGTEEIVRRAGITRGALYHQFVDKRDLFRAICESLVADMASRIFDATMAEGLEETDELAVGCALLIDLFSEPEIRQLLLRDGPAVLGWEEWRALQQPVSLGLLVHALEHLAEADRIARAQVEPLAQMLFGALCQAGVAIANAPDPEHARQGYAEALERLLQGLGAGRPPSATVADR